MRKKILKILIFNWRDIKHPDKGGVEVLNHEIAKRWVRAGHRVTIVCGSFKGGVGQEEIDGINIIRLGNKLTLYYKAFRYYQKNLKGKYDVVIDELNAICFMTIWYVKEPVVPLVLQLSRAVWFYEAIFPISLVGFLLEMLLARQYRKLNTLVISDSTKQDLLKLGFDSQKVHVFPLGINFEPLGQLSSKENESTIIYVGRLKPSKRAHHLIRAFSCIKKSKPDAKLWIVGSGSTAYQRKLSNLIAKLKIENITFFGFVDKKEKMELMKSAHVIAVPSLREGWGLIVTEANAMGTPAVVYNVTGLRDSTKDGITGIIVKKNNPDCLAKSILRILNDDELRNKLAGNALMWAREFSWDKSAGDALEYIEEVLEKHRNSSAKST